MWHPSDWLANQLSDWLQKFKARKGLDQTPAIVTGADGQQVLLHIGCGQASLDDIALPGFHDTPWHEVRLDADASVFPDIIGTMADMSAVPDGFADAIYSSHGIEHLYWHDVPQALAEFKRVLKDNGVAVITCPDVQAAAEMIAQDRMFDTAYESAAGAITPFDILYSYRPFVQANPQWMSHHCGFTLTTLMQVLTDAGFAAMYGIRRTGGFDLWVLACKTEQSKAQLETMAKVFLPHPG